ncbi:MAG TPA: AfsR/SARP family transcriptional regulator [Streptosporangiaceae bacterium]|nr:AfsR/SARP family transcriptional regulator [Streptosporangiaceae bacterium]
MSTVPTDMQIELLGPFSVRINQLPVMPDAAKPSAVLALLALNAGSVVTVVSLMEELWGETPPPSALTTLQTYILESRKRIAAAIGPGQDPKWVLQTRQNGYLLDAPGARIDVEEFRELAHAGRAASEGGDHRAAAELLGRALAIWRGPALIDVRKGRVLELEVTALEESRLAVLGRRLDADLALGRHADIISELTALVASHPLNENFAAQLITALYRTGRISRALQVFQRLRNSLVDELGVEPSAQLQRLQHAILSRDPSLDAA